MAREWSEPRGYRHLDRPVSPKFIAEVPNPAFVAVHSFSPLIRFEKISKRYKPAQRTTVVKARPIMFASHRDSAIFGYYSRELTQKLEDFYKRAGLEENVLAYRKLGRGNESFSAEVYRFAVANSPCAILAFDVENFFGSLDHKLLKKRLKDTLGVQELPKDWYQVFKAITSYHYVQLSDLKRDAIIGPRMRVATAQPIATIAEVKDRGIAIHGPDNPTAGIPQGTPISAVLSNLYMQDVDIALAALASECGGMYRRYSDDILIVCPAAKAADFVEATRARLLSAKLALNDAKTERIIFDPAAPVGAAVIQYLGFSLSPKGVALRPSTLSRRWRKLRGALRRARKSAVRAIEEGRSQVVSTKKLRRQFTPTGPRNFSTYARRASKAFPSSAVILRQIRRLERKAAAEIAAHKASFSNPGGS